MKLKYELSPPQNCYPVMIDKFYLHSKDKSVFFNYIQNVQYPSAGLGGGVSQFFMPDNITVQLTVARAVDNEGEIHIEGIGVVPDIRVPVTIETLFSDEDVILEEAINFLNQELGLD